MANVTTSSAAFAADGTPAPSTPPLSWTGVILSAPAIVPDPKVKTPLKVFIGKALASYLPKFQLAPLPASGISTNPQVHNLYRTDPLIYHGGVQVRWGFETLKALDAIQETVETITFPFLVLHGVEDTIISITGSIEFHSRAASRDKAIKTYPGLKHELLNEPREARHLVVRDISEWIEARIAS
jgi:acylglycerol lipase